MQQIRLLSAVEFRGFAGYQGGNALVVGQLALHQLGIAHGLRPHEAVMKAVPATAVVGRHHGGDSSDGGRAFAATPATPTA